MKRGLLLCAVLFAPGCVVVDLGVTNPIPGLSRVAVVPFYNLSTEPAADGYRFAEAYYAELQKVPGFQVLPIGVAEAAIQDHRLDMQSPADAIKLGQLLNVDAVVIGAITDYTPYYPPRVGLQVSWYSPHPWGFSPGVPTDSFAREAILRAGICPEMDAENCPPPEGFWNRAKHWFKKQYRNIRVKNATVFRGQSEAVFPPLAPPPAEFEPEHNAEPAPPRPLVPPPAAPPENLDPPEIPGEPSIGIRYEPLMSYTRLFDATDSALTATLRDYVELRDDQRAGGWEAWLHRPEDFIRFATHRMIVEMLALHGGESRRRVIFVWRRER